MVFEKNEGGARDRVELERVPETRIRSLERIREGTAACTAVVMAGTSYEGLAPQGQECVRERIVEDLKKAAGSADRVKLVARIFDVFPIKAIIEAVLPGAGDLGAEVVNFCYLYGEACYSGLGAEKRSELVKLSIKDFFIGLIPGVGDVADYFYKSNVKAAGFFEERVERLMKEAAQNGVDPEKLKAVELSRKKVGRALKVGGWMLKKR
ncbi:MAG: hypothetical protein ACD_28C00300G0015 [uncultured bacterium]|nr:MAG: hypothetical protein ACD_28C00300G0015 [uncultured bacterium]